MEFHDELMYPNLLVASRDELLTILGDAVIAAGLAHPSYTAALLERERDYPTGLPVAGGVAIPHTAAEQVTGNTIAVAALAQPVTFSEMGGSGTEIEVKTVFLLVFADSASHVPLLSKLIGKIQDAEFITAIGKATDRAGLADVLAETFTD